MRITIKFSPEDVCDMSFCDQNNCGDDIRVDTSAIRNLEDWLSNDKTSVIINCTHGGKRALVKNNILYATIN
ncbi:hypothetical protein [Clostridium uliginosum]|uniref:Uncharacterized protein n=1 Tax=Clostridium uliginosum TaxID=119641 RepID=A0A1I1GXV0_9CLOT|nr:hypothetical protein [Clostridium uliginosum]SFC16504.1 hypothetical protein SAMN05421842_101102 [Clostridium uliginosum]